MTVSDNWLVNIGVSINTTVVPIPAFNNCMLVGVMPTQSSPYQSPPASWSGETYKSYSDSASFSTDFSPLLANAIAYGDTIQANRFQWLLNAASAHFAQTPTPSILYVSAIAPPTASIATTFSFVVVDVVASAATTIKAGTVLTPQSPATNPYVLLENYVIPAAGTYQVTFYSEDSSTVIASAHFTAISPVNAAISSVTNPLAANNAIAGTLSVPNYTTFFSALSLAQNSWYGCTIADQILADDYSIVNVLITTSAAVTIPVGTALTPTTATSPYKLLQAYALPAAGTYLVPFYSTDGTTVVSANTFNAISPALSAVTGVTNIAQSITGIPGVTTSTTGLSAAMTGLRSTNNQKKLFVETNDSTQAGVIQAASGSKDILVCYHSKNLQHYLATTQASISAAALSEYFTDLFAVGVGLKQMSSMQLAGQPQDPTILTTNIGEPDEAGSSSNLIGWNNNVYATFGTLSTMQYGMMSSSLPAAIVYLDQIVGADYLQFVAQADLVTFIIGRQPTGGVLYNDVGIQEVLNVFKGAVQKAVNQNIVQNPLNSAYVYSNYAQVSDADKAARIYKDLAFNGQFLSRIQRLSLKINLSL